MVWSRPGVSDSILSQEVSKLVRGELRTPVTHHFFWKAIGRKKVTQIADGLLCCRLCGGEDLRLLGVGVDGHEEIFPLILGIVDMHSLPRSCRP